MWNLRNEPGGGGEERQTKKQTFNRREKTDGYQRGGGWGEMGWIGDGDEGGHLSGMSTRGLYGSVESLNSAPETNITLYVNYTGI